VSQQALERGKVQFRNRLLSPKQNHVLEKQDWEKYDRKNRILLSSLSKFEIQSPCHTICNLQFSGSCFSCTGSCFSVTGSQKSCFCQYSSSFPCHAFWRHKTEDVVHCTQYARFQFGVQKWSDCLFFRNLSASDKAVFKTSVLRPFSFPQGENCARTNYCLPTILGGGIENKASDISAAIFISRFNSISPKTKKSVFGPLAHFALLSFFGRFD